MNDSVIKVERLGKQYLIGHERFTDLRQTISARIKKAFDSSSRQESFWALRDVSFEINQGDAIGIIGRNGAGKSTLLKLLSRITHPTTGRFEIKGRVSSLLEVGTGFHAELTGRENIFLNGTILGMRRAEIKARYNDIVEFSGISQFIETPVKHYSSGMKVRLAFAVAAHLDPEILIVDEVLAVGDAEFQKKCIAKMKEVTSDHGRTIVIVSHDMAAVGNLCTKTILIDHGTVVANGKTSSVISQYLNSHITNSEFLPVDGKSKIQFQQVQSFFIDENGNRKISKSLPIGAVTGFELKIFHRGERTETYFALTIFNSHGYKILTLDNMYQQKPLIVTNSENVVLCYVDGLNLLPDTYFVSLWCADGFETFQHLEKIFTFQVEATDLLGTGRMQNARQHGVIYLNSNWSLNE